MAYKRQIDRLPIVPKDAKEFNVTCHFCIVGCGYKAYTWPTNKQGGVAPGQNKFGVDLAKQQPADTGAWYAPLCTTSSGRTVKMFTSSSSRTRIAW